ncbi:MAG: response regulator [Flavobacteriales bacterium]|nr:response regulator [Flavobacteriales bacterium]
MLGGNLTVESEFGQGSTFQMTLPAKSKEIEKPLSQNSTQNHNYTLAVVDDDTSLLQLTTTFLKLHQFNVLSFNHPKELLEALHTTKVDVVFTDIQMPEMSGFELLEQIPSSLPIIAITGQRQWEKEYYKNKGFAALLYKPYTSEELISVLNQVLHTPIEINQKQILKKEENTTEEYNLSVLKTMLDNDQEAIRDVLYSYIENTRSSLIQIEKAIEEKNYSLVESISHRMIPMTHQVGAKHIVPLLQELETCNTSNFSNSALQKLFNEARNKLTKLIDTLEKELIL